MKITFDCYGTLLNTTGVSKKLGEIAETAGVKPQLAINQFFTYEERLMMVDRLIPFEALIMEALKFVDMELGTDSRFAGQFEALLTAFKNFRPFPEVNLALSRLKQAGHQLYLMSNSSEMLMNEHLEKFGVMFDDIFLPEQTHCYKPDLSFFKAVANQLDFKHNDHIHVAKGFWWDIVPCSRLKWRKIWINRDGLSGRKTFKPYGELKDLSRLPEVLNQYR